jgi:hypothetical protein
MLCQPILMARPPAHLRGRSQFQYGVHGRPLESLSPVRLQVPRALQATSMPDCCSNGCSHLLLMSLKGPTGLLL